MKILRISVIGSAGIPANYGGFETLVHNLAEFHHRNHLNLELVVYCSEKNYETLPARFLDTKLRYLPLSANGIWSIPYDIWSILRAVINKSDVLLVLGISGAVVLPVLHLLCRKRVVTNIDGIEWRREKWHCLARWFLRFFEYLAVRYSDVVVADNTAIETYLHRKYGVQAAVIAYGGDHALQSESTRPNQIDLPSDYALSVCRIEPENNIHIILEAFSNTPDVPLIMVGNWNNSAYGQNLRSTYVDRSSLHLLDPIYDPGILKYLRSNARVYVHGHSAGGTNPSLVEAMHFGIPVLAFDCDFNRSTTEECCLYFSDVALLVGQLKQVGCPKMSSIGAKMKEIAVRRYTWEVVAKQYFDLLVNKNEMAFPRHSFHHP